MKYKKPEGQEKELELFATSPFSLANTVTSPRVTTFWPLTQDEYGPILNFKQVEFYRIDFQGPR